MRKIIMLIATLMGVSAIAQDHTALVVNLKDGTQHVYAFNDTPRVTFEGSTVNVVSKAASNSYEVDDIESYATEYREETTGVEAANAADFLFRNVAPDRYMVSGKAVKEVYIYSTDGLLLGREIAVEDVPVEVNLSDQRPGVYLVVVNLGARNQTVKVIKK